MGPILATTEISGRGWGYDKPLRLEVRGGLHFIKANKSPHFSITGDITKPWPCRDNFIAGGCLHEEIQKHFPNRFSDLIALHLSNLEGEPMHAAANGLYWLAGAEAGTHDHFGQRYHGGNSTPAKSPAECLSIGARLLRVSEDEALALLSRMRSHGDPREVIKAYAEEQRPRWKAEADAAIKAHNLAVYGDKWEG